MPSARAERAMAPRFSGSLSPSSTATGRAVRSTSSTAGSGRRSAAATAPRCRSNPTVAASTGTRRDVDRARERSRRGRAGRGARREQDRANDVARVEQPLDGRDAFGDEDLVALGRRRAGGIGQLHVVGEPWVGRVVDGIVRRHRASVSDVDLTLPRDGANIEQMSANTGSLLIQGSLFGSTNRPSTTTFPACSGSSSTTSWLDHGAGLAARPRGRLRPALHELPWRQRTVTMYERRLPEPRLTWWWSVDGGGPEPLPVLADVRHALEPPLRRGVRLDRVQLLPPRRGLRGLARRPPPPHGRRTRRGDRQRRPPRPLRLRPRGGGRARSFDLGHGDLFVMGGACQHDWEHCVPKVRSRRVRASRSRTARGQRRFREVPRRVWDMSRYVDRRGRAGDPRAGAGRRLAGSPAGRPLLDTS